LKHDLKTWPEYFQAIVSHQKNFELRYNDRDYKAGDVLCLLEFDPCKGCRGKGRVSSLGYLQEIPPCPDCNGAGGKYTGRTSTHVVMYMMSGHEALRSGYVILAIRPFIEGELGTQLTPQPSNATREMVSAAFLRMGEWLAKGGRLVHGSAKAGAPTPNLLRIQCDMIVARPAEAETPRIIVQ
jgi:hypothetical protein